MPYRSRRRLPRRPGFQTAQGPPRGRYSVLPRVLLRAALIAISVATMSRPVAAQEVGSASKVVNRVLGTSLGYEIKIEQPIRFREEINTQQKSASTISFKDGTKFSIGEESQVTIDEFIYDPSAKSLDASIRVVKGVFRYVGGSAVAKKVTLETQTATLGIRGTSFDVVADRLLAAVFVHEGTVALQGGGTELALGPGQFAVVRAGAVPSAAPAPAWFLERIGKMAALLGLPAQPAKTGEAAGGRARSAPVRSAPVR